MMQVKKTNTHTSSGDTDLLAEEDAGKYAEIILPPGGITLERVEKVLIKQALARFSGNQTKAAKCLGMSRDTLRYRMKKFGISRD